MPVPQASLPHQPASQQPSPVGIVEAEEILNHVLQIAQHWGFLPRLLVTCVVFWNLLLALTGFFQQPVKLFLSRDPPQGIESHHWAFRASVQEKVASPAPLEASRDPWLP